VVANKGGSGWNLHGFAIDAGGESHDCDHGVHHAEGEEAVLQDSAHQAHQLEREILFFTNQISFLFNLM